MSETLIEIDWEEIVARTEKAVLLKFENGSKIWVPRSLIQNDWKAEAYILIPIWFARQEQLI